MMMDDEFDPDAELDEDGLPLNDEDMDDEEDDDLESEEDTEDEDPELM